LPEGHQRKFSYKKYYPQGGDFLYETLGPDFRRWKAGKYLCIQIRKEAAPGYPSVHQKIFFVIQCHHAKVDISSAEERIKKRTTILLSFN